MACSYAQRATRGPLSQGPYCFRILSRWFMCLRSLGNRYRSSREQMQSECRLGHGSEFLLAKSRLGADFFGGVVQPLQIPRKVAKREMVLDAASRVLADQVPL